MENVEQQEDLHDSGHPKHLVLAVPVAPLGFIVYKVFKIPYVINTHGGDIPGFTPEQPTILFRYLKSKK